jgi:hypothetical protein
MIFKNMKIVHVSERGGIQIGAGVVVMYDDDGTRAALIDCFNQPDNLLRIGVRCNKINYANHNILLCLQ